MKERLYYLDKKFQFVLKDLNLEPRDVLRQAQLPPDFFEQKFLPLTPADYFRFWGVLEKEAPLKAFPLVLAQAVTVESFNPPIFACFCSENLRSGLDRLAHYKDLVAPIQFAVYHNSSLTSVALYPLSELGTCPVSILAFEFAFLVRLARLATRKHIVPEAIYSPYTLPEQPLYEDFFGVKIEKSKINQIVFSSHDASIPFLSSHHAMWQFFEPQLDMQLKFSDEGNLTERVKLLLRGLLAGGPPQIERVAEQLSMSVRTLQRQLKQENTSFQKILTNLRHELALHYLKNTDYSDVDIAFLLGYRETNFFKRGFRQWTGRSFGEFMRH